MPLSDLPPQIVGSEALPTPDTFGRAGKLTLCC